MAKQKVQYTHESVRVQKNVLDNVRSHVSKTKQSMSGFVEIAINERLQKDSFEWPVKKETK